MLRIIDILSSLYFFIRPLLVLTAYDLIIPFYLVEILDGRITVYLILSVKVLCICSIDSRGSYDL